MEKDLSKLGEMITEHNVSVAKQVYEFNVKLMNDYLELGRTIVAATPVFGQMVSHQTKKV